ncbi:MAG: signal peptidase [Blastopirellula sp.]|nr:MAG: signal peptidase [Blastopirellula sp.]
MQMIGVFTSRAKDNFKRDDEVVVRTKRGIELGMVLCEATEQAMAHLNSPGQGNILRLKSEEDSNEFDHMITMVENEIKVCKKCIADLGLDMQLVDIEHLFGGERIVIYYLAENRVDFRELVKQLATEFRTRIEMKQIGVRDEAKLLADYGDCGKPVCCNTHLAQMPPVSMKMAKMQKATLDPTKISGRCGRLKCCLRYEYDTYEELHKELPPIGSEIITRDGKGKVLNHEILTSKLLIRTEDSRNVLIDAAEVLTITKRGEGPTYEKKRRSKPVPE